YAAPCSLLRQLPLTLEWNATALGLLLLGSLSHAVGMPQPIFWIAAVALLAAGVGQAVRTALGVDRRSLPGWRTCLLVAALSYLGPLARAVARTRGHLSGISRMQRVPRAQAAQPPDLHLLRRGFSVSYWNETAIEKESCLSALLEFLRPRDFHVVPDDGWQPWDLLLYQGVWLRGQIKVLVANHGAERRQVDVGIELRRTLLAKLLTGAWAMGAMLSTLLGSWPAVGLFAGAAL